MPNLHEFTIRERFYTSSDLSEIITHLTAIRDALVSKE